MKIEELRNVSSEAGIIATLIWNPDFSFYSEHLLPNHFTDPANRCIYAAITGLARKNISTIDPYNIMEFLNSSDAIRKSAEGITVESLNELMEASEDLARHTPEEYKMLVDNVLDCAFRRDIIRTLKSCSDLCYKGDRDTVQQQIYNTIDSVMTDYSTTDDIPQYRDVIDGCWEEIKSRQSNGYAGIPFKFPTLNEYATIEPGELFIFAAEAKQGKSMMLLNCATDLLKQDLSVLYIDSELNTRLHTARLLSHLTGVEYRRLTTGNYSGEEAGKIENAKSWLKTRKYTHLYIPMFDQQSIYTAVKKVKHTQGLDVLIIDYFKGSGTGDAWDSYAELGRFVDRIPCPR